jgi:hypothetical protein
MTIVQGSHVALRSLHLRTPPWQTPSLVSCLSSKEWFFEVIFGVVVWLGERLGLTMQFILASWEFARLLMLRQKLFRVLLLWNHVRDRLRHITSVGWHGLRLNYFLGFPHKFIIGFWVVMGRRPERLRVAVLDRLINRLLDVAAWFDLLIAGCGHSQVIWFILLLIRKLYILLEPRWLLRLT